MLLNGVGVMVMDEDGPHRTIVADPGRIFVGTELENIYLELSNGSIHEYDSQHPDHYSTTTFGRLTLSWRFWGSPLRWSATEED